MNGTFGFQQFVQWRRLDRPPCQSVEMRKRDFVAQAVNYLGL
jgi:hypothetical protein